MTKGIKSIHFSFGENDLTHFGGLFLIHSFCKKLRLKRYLQTYVKLRHRNQEYQTAEFILILLYTIILGIGRVENTRFLQSNGVVKKIIGLKKFPNPTTIRRFLYRLTPNAIHQIIKVHDLIQKKIFFTNHTKTSVTFDIDATVLTVYGKQQKAKVGFNPKRRGARSYLGIFCFESNREFWYGKLISGNDSQIKVAPYIIKSSLSKLPYPIHRIRIRADSAFYGHKFIEDFLENRDIIDRNIVYAIDTQIKGPMLSKMNYAKYTLYKKDWEVAEFYYQPDRWKKSHRFIVERRLLPEDSEEKAQLKLFEMNKYGYRVLVTNMKIKPENIWNFYSQRSAGAEQNIKELKINYPLAKIPTRNYTANIAYFQILLFAFNIINWFKWLCLPEQYQHARLQTIREQLLSIPARLTKTDNKNTLKFPAGYQYKDVFNYAMTNIKHMKQI
jgi:hypothetical protein